MFKINSISRFSSDTVKVSITCNVKDWNTCKRKGQLGSLYGIDISNAVYQMHGVKASNPTVSDDKRASMTGVKSIDLYYRDSEWSAPIDNVIRMPNLFASNASAKAIRGGGASPIDSVDSVVTVDFINRRKIA